MKRQMGDDGGEQVAVEDEPVAAEEPSRVVFVRHVDTDPVEGGEPSVRLTNQSRGR